MSSENVQSEEEESISCLPPTYRDLVNQIAASKDLLMYGHLYHDTVALAYDPPHLALQRWGGASNNFSRQLQDVLKRVTGTEWTVMWGDPSLDTVKTLAAEDQATKVQKIQLAEAHPIVRSFVEAFPGAKIEIQPKGE